jgi:hypothetical protein
MTSQLRGIGVGGRTALARHLGGALDPSLMLSAADVVMAGITDSRAAEIGMTSMTTVETGTVSKSLPKIWLIGEAIGWSDWRILSQNCTTVEQSHHDPSFEDLVECWERKSGS